MDIVQMLRVLSLLNAAAVAGAACVEPCLYYAEREAIKRVQLQSSTGMVAGGTPIQTIYQGGRGINVLALDHSGGRIFWYDYGSRMIYRGYQNGTGVMQLIKYGVSFCEGIAFDWTANNIYWTDSWHDWIEVATADGKHRKVLISGGMEQPRGIIVAPNDGYLFWTEFGKKPRIERANLDGTARQVITESSLVYPNDLQIDYGAKRLYWIDAYTDKVESSDFSGVGRRIEVDVSYAGRLAMHPYSMALFAQHSSIFFTDWYRSWVIYKSLTSAAISILQTRTTRLKQIGQVRILHASNQPPGSSQCQQNNGNCSHLCLRLNGRSYACACPTGFVLRNNECKVTELDYQAFLLDGSDANSKIFHISKFVNQSQYSFEALKPRESGRPVGVDFDQKQNLIYWGDVRLNKIYKMYLNGTGFQVVSNTGIETPEGLVIDADIGLLYFADYNYEKIEVMKVDGSMRKILIKSNIVNPRDIQLYHEKGLMFFSDWASDYPKIESSFMDGTNRKVIISSAIETPSGLAVDKTEERLYWCDMSLNRIESANLDGTDRRVLFDHGGYDPNFPLESVSGEIQSPYGLAIHRDQVYWTDWTRRAVFAADKRFGGKINFVTGGLVKPMQIHVYSNKVAKDYKKLYFFSRAREDPANPLSQPCFARNCTGTFFQEPALCPQGYVQSRFGSTCANCSAPFGVYGRRCKCQDWMSCAHRIYLKLSCSASRPFMQIKVRECVKVINPGHCPSTSGCPGTSVQNCSSDGDCTDNQKCCKTGCGKKCLLSRQLPGTHPCQVNNGGCSHFCFRIPNSYSCGCPDTMTLQPADNKTCILKSGPCSTKMPCLNEGICRDSSARSYECACKPGFTGIRCEKCAVCPVNTTCSKNGGAVRCNCPPDYCENNGTCIATGNKTVCTCLNGFVGERCQTYNPCPENYCNKNGICFLHNGKHKCNCTVDFTGERCEQLTACLSNPCVNGGTCSYRRHGQTITRFCICPGNFTGPMCETTIACSPNPCLHNGYCKSFGNHYQCVCSNGYSGDQCQFYDTCLAKPCQNNASCSSRENVTYCQCLPNLTGRLCETEVTCPRDYCKNGGDCVVTNFRRMCNCPKFYTGEYCETYIPCKSNPCMRNSQCKPVPGGDFKCDCPAGYWGKTCQHEDKCISGPCANGGTCKKVESDTGFVCDCAKGYIGAKCQTFNSCSSNPCQNFGTCHLIGKSYSCNCSQGYVGANCETRDFCLESECREISQCVNGSTGYTCSCDIGYTGWYCKTLIDHCQLAGSICQNGGTCINRLDGASCNCSLFFAGKNCQINYHDHITVINYMQDPSTPLSTEQIREELAQEYTAYCLKVDCKQNSVLSRKRRDVKETVDVRGDDIIMMTGYPKRISDSSMELRYAVLGNDGTAFLISSSVAVNGFESFKSSFAASLNIKIIKVYKISTVPPKSGKNKGKDTDSSTGGLAAGMVILVLCLITAMVLLTYFYKKRRNNASKSFTAFDNALYRSNADLQEAKEPSVVISNDKANIQSESNTKLNALEFDNSIYDARDDYAEVVTVDFTRDDYSKQEDGRIVFDSANGMTGLVNPYIDLPENEKSQSSLVRTDSVNIVSSSDVRVGTVAAIEVYEDDFMSKRKPKQADRLQDNFRPVRSLQVKSINEDAVDGLTGFANPCVAMDDNIFSEEDTKDATELSAALDLAADGDVNGADENTLDAQDFDTGTRKITEQEKVIEKRTVTWADIKDDSDLESSA